MKIYSIISTIFKHFQVYAHTSLYVVYIYTFMHAFVYIFSAKKQRRRGTAATAPYFY